MTYQLIADGCIFWQGDAIPSAAEIAKAQQQALDCAECWSKKLELVLDGKFVQFV